jgi:hypothetical protein
MKKAQPDPLLQKPVDKMTNDEFMEFVVDRMMGGWVPIKTYLKWFSSETKLAIETRLQRGYWQKGVHYVTPKGGTAWVNVKAIREWVTTTRDD